MTKPSNKGTGKGKQQGNPLPEDPASVRKRERQAVELRNAKLTYAEIAERIGYADAESARRAVLRCYERDISKDVEEIRQRELATLEALEQSLYAKARQGDERAILTLLRIQDQRMKLLAGLKAPERLEVQRTETPSERAATVLDDLSRRREEKRRAAS